MNLEALREARPGAPQLWGNLTPTLSLTFATAH